MKVKFRFFLLAYIFLSNVKSICGVSFPVVVINVFVFFLLCFNAEEIRLFKLEIEKLEDEKEELKKKFENDVNILEQQRQSSNETTIRKLNDDFKVSLEEKEGMKIFIFSALCLVFEQFIETIVIASVTG